QTTDNVQAFGRCPTSQTEDVHHCSELEVLTLLQESQERVRLSEPLTSGILKIQLNIGVKSEMGLVALEKEHLEGDLHSLRKRNPLRPVVVWPALTATTLALDESQFRVAQILPDVVASVVRDFVRRS